MFDSQGCNLYKGWGEGGRVLTLRLVAADKGLRRIEIKRYWS